MSNGGISEGSEIDPGFDPRWLGASIPDEHWHFHRQLLERYGIVLGPGEYSRIRKEILEGKALLVERRRDNSAIYSVKIRSAKHRIFVLATGQRIHTAWPPEKRLADKRRELQAERSQLPDGEKGRQVAEHPERLTALRRVQGEKT